MSVLATALSRAMRASAHDLVVFDKDADAWTRHPWSQVHARAEGIATRILDQPQPGRGRPGRRADRGLRRGRSRDLAGRPERVDPARTGPRRRPAAVGPGHADPVRRPRRAHGLQPRRRTRPAQRCGRAADRARPRGRRARTVHRLHAGRGCRRNAGDIAGHRRLHRKSAHRAAVSRGGAEQRERPAQPFRCRPGGATAGVPGCRSITTWV